MAAIPPMESPCIKLCVVDPRAGLCIGCGRTLAEIAAWTTFSNGERRRVMAELAQRLAALQSNAASAAPGGAP
jgi:predicted Fe-S protein YdhL (DUF1289 family)